jgi:hypothetical protein
MGLFPVLRKRLGNHNLNTGQTLPVTAQPSSHPDTNYRESGLVRWEIPDVNPLKADIIVGMSLAEGIPDITGARADMPREVC